MLSGSSLAEYGDLKEFLDLEGLVDGNSLGKGTYYKHCLDYSSCSLKQHLIILKIKGRVLLQVFHQ